MLDHQFSGSGLYLHHHLLQYACEPEGTLIAIIHRRLGVFAHLQTLLEGVAIGHQPGHGHSSLFLAVDEELAFSLVGAGLVKGEAKHGFAGRDRIFRDNGIVPQPQEIVVVDQMTVLDIERQPCKPPTYGQDGPSAPLSGISAYAVIV